MRPFYKNPEDWVKIVMCEHCNIPLKEFEECPKCGSRAKHEVKYTKKKNK